MANLVTKKQKTHPHYELLYWPGMPGRGEYIRLPLEAAGVSYSDVGNEQDKGFEVVKGAIDPESTGDSDGNPPLFAPPALKVPGEGVDGKALVIHQTPNILGYLAPRIGLVSEQEPLAFHTNQIALTALDLSNEAHDTHHPGTPAQTFLCIHMLIQAVAVMEYYEDQKTEALRKAKDFRASRMPKFFSYFERNLRSNEAHGDGKYLVGSKLSYADTVSFFRRCTSDSLELHI